MKRIWFVVVLTVCELMQISILAGAQGNPDIVWMQGNSFSSPRAVYSPDGQYIASGDVYGAVKIRRVSDQTLVRTLNTYISGLSDLSIATLPGGQTILLTGGSDRIGNTYSPPSVKVWDFTTGSLLKTIPNAMLYQVSLDGKYILYGPIVNGQPTGTALLRWTDDTTIINLPNALGPFAFSPDSREVTTGDRNGTRYFYSTVSGSLLRSWTTTLSNYVYDGLIYLDANRLAYLASNTRIVFVVNSATGTVLKQLTGGPGSPYGLYQKLTYAPSTGRLYAGGRFTISGQPYGYGLIDTWDVFSSSLTYSRLVQTPETNVDSITGFSLSPDESHLLFSGFYQYGEGLLNEYRTSDGSLLGRAEGHSQNVMAVAWSPDRQILASCGGEGDYAVRIWRASDGVLLNTIAEATVGLNIFQSLAFSPDGQTLVVAGNPVGPVAGSRIYILRVSDGSLARSFPINSINASMNAIALSPDGQTIATVDAIGSLIYLWNVATGGLIRLTGGIQHFAVVYSPDGQTLAAASPQGVQIYDANTLALKKQFATSIAISQSLAYSPDGSLLAIGQGFTGGNSGGKIEVRRTVDGTTAFGPLTGHTNDIYALGFGTDGKTLFSGSRDATIRVWDMTNGAQLQLWNQETGGTGAQLGVTSLALSGDGKFFAFGKGEGTVVVANNPYFIALSISGVGTSSLTATSTFVNWMTNRKADSVVDYGLTSAYGSTVGSATFGTSHSQALTSLAPATLYHYRVHSTDAFGNTAQSGDLTFVTTPANTAKLDVSGYAFRRVGSSLFLDITLKNVGPVLATNVKVTGGQLSTVSSSGLPVAFPNIAAGGSQTVTPTLTFAAASFPSATKTTLTVSGSYMGGTFNASFRVTVP